MKFMEVRHHVAIAGRVTDSVTRKPLGGVVVELAEMPATMKTRPAAKSMRYGSRWRSMAERPDRTRTAPDGVFYFLDLPDGKYTISAEFPPFGKRYGTARATCTVSPDAQGHVKPGFVEIGLPSTTVQGKVTGTGQRAGVVMAEIRIKGSGEHAFTNAQGDYLLTGVEPGKRTVLVTAQGYKAASKPVTIEHPGNLATLNFALAREAAG